MEEIKEIETYISILENISKKVIQELNNIDKNNLVLQELRKEYTNFDELFDNL